MLDITIENMTIDHLDQIEEVELLSFAIPWPRQSFYNELNNHLATYIVAEYDNKVIGYAGMWRIIDEGHITNIAVHPEYRGAGLGNLIIEVLVSDAKDEGVSAMTLEVRVNNLPALNLYKKYGFIEVAVRKNYYQDTGEDAIIMWKYDMC
jgi:ribosomal-protein-alanine N-acetyltransferase